MEVQTENAQVEASVPEGRTYAAWLSDARKSNDRQLELANELRKCWPAWKADCEYATWEECIQAEFGMSAGALRERNSYRRRKARKAVEPPQGSTESVRHPDGPSEVEQDQQPSEPESRSTARPRTRRREPLDPDLLLERTASNVLDAADKFLTLLRQVPRSSHLVYVEEVNRVIDAWTEVRNQLWGTAGAAPSGAGEV